MACYEFSVTQFRPFKPLHYVQHDLSTVFAPPYDVLSAADRAAMLEADPHNSVAIDFPPGREDPSAYAGVAGLLSGWVADGTLRWETEESFSIVRMTAPTVGDIAGRTTTGVIGALTLCDPGTGDILPHEETTSKDKADRLTLIRAAKINTSPIWGLSMTSGLGVLLSTAIANTPPAAKGTDSDGVLHELWILNDASTINAIASAVDQSPVVLADGHHRFETALAYQAEQPAANTGNVEPTGVKPPTGSDAIMTMIVELAPSELEVRPIHRLVDLPSGVSGESLVQTLSPWFRTEPAPATVAAALAQGGAASALVVNDLPSRGALLLVTATGCFFLTPNEAAFGPALTLDSERVRKATTEGEPTAALRFHHDATHIYHEVLSGRSAAGILLRPATVDQIHAVADKRSRMPAKTTFFWPKPRTGMVFRSVE
jgi:uncharacterized protein (DUF1015 family)